jgi:hypothetical protein
MTIAIGDKVPVVDLYRMGKKGPEKGFFGIRTVRRPEDRSFCRAGRVYAHLLPGASAWIRGEGRRAAGQGGRSDSMPVGERCVRHGCMGQAAERG